MGIDFDAQLARFRAAHQPQRATFADAPWSYIVGGRGPETLLFLPGAPGIAEMAFPYIAAFEQRYRVIAPSYPAEVGTLEQLLAGITALVEAETAGPFHLIGASYSGIVAQYVLQRHPDRILSLLIGDTGVPRRDRAMALRLAIAIIARLPRLGLHATLAGSLTYVLAGSTPAHRFWQRYFKGVVAMLTVPEFTNRVRVMIDMDERGRELQPAPRWHGPTLLMETADDPLFAAAERVALRARYPYAEIHTFYTKGHITAL
ncbi:MAG: alpha/beta hydrolase, partial [Chloroflexales bacterium]